GHSLGRFDLHVSRGLRRLNPGRIGRHVLVDQRANPLHVLLHVFNLVGDDRLLHLAAAATPAIRFLFRGRGRGGGVGQRRLLYLPVGAVRALLLLLLLLFSLQRDLRGFDPRVLSEGRLVGGQRLLDRGSAILAGRRLRDGFGEADDPRCQRQNHGVHDFHVTLLVWRPAVTGKPHTEMRVLN